MVSRSSLARYINAVISGGGTRSKTVLMSYFEQNKPYNHRGGGFVVAATQGKPITDYFLMFS
jgi:hypothetical protein